MAQLLVRKLPDKLVSRLKKVATESGISSEEAHRQILQKALLSEESQKNRFAPLKEILVDMNDADDDFHFKRQAELPQAPDFS